MITRLGSFLVGFLGLIAIPLKAGELDFFERRIRPLFARHCYSCHSESAKTVHGGLKLDSTVAIQLGGDSGKLYVAGDPAASRLIQAVRHDGDIPMPPEGRLPSREVNWLVEWIQRGAVLPDANEPSTVTRQKIDYEQGRRHWSFQNVTLQPKPELNLQGWSRRRIDEFVLAKMEEQGLSPGARASRTTLIRRLSFTLTGMPPTPSEVQRFLADDSADAYRRLVEQLLESPEYGQHWARWWLDKARYTDRTASWLYQTGQAHHYRDWVVNALASDMPYDEFIHRQLATDLMDETGPEDLGALGFLSLSPTYWKELKLPCEVIKTIVADEWEERVDAVSRTFLGLTVACARCHDHKFDPISAEDYYALAGVFASCRQVERPLIAEADYAPVREAKKQLAKLEQEIKNLKKKDSDDKEQNLAQLQDQIRQIKSMPLFDAPMANAMSEESMFVVRAGKTAQEGTRLEYRSEPRDLPKYIRGNPNRPGPIVPRRFLTVFSETPTQFKNGSGRLDLAQALTTTAKSLTARVIVNRVWREHFGQGIVSTPSNFGRQGASPTHRELLDDLAARLIHNRWSLKWLHREILLSATWQQASDNPSSIESDPSNQWLSRMNRRRLTFEQWRDGLLMFCDGLDRSFGGPSIELDSNDNHRRTLYATVHRRDMSPTLMIHDFPDPTQHSPHRAETFTPLQGLYALNGPLLLQSANALVKQAEERKDLDEQVSEFYWKLYSRAPLERELSLAKAFLTNEGMTTEVSNNRWQQYVQVLFASNELLFID